MKLATALAVAATIAATSAHATDTTLDQMPPQLETRFALSALPPALRDNATVFLLDTKKGYTLSRQGTTGLACLVQRTQWELSDFRNDIYYAVCYDAAGAETYLKYVRDAAALRAQGLTPTALKAEIEKRYEDKTYKVPDKPGLSYMIGPLMRTIGPPDFKVHTMAMPHLMFYAPFITNADIGAAPDLADPASLQYPFIDRQGNGEQSYMIQMIGEAEKARILVEEKELIDDLCAYRDVLCLDHTQH
jgi:hypothetical protein